MDTFHFRAIYRIFPKVASIYQDSRAILGLSL
jgi:hypothetical protein